METVVGLTRPGVVRGPFVSLGVCGKQFGLACPTDVVTDTEAVQ